MSVSILIAEDHNVVRQGLKRLLEAERDFRVVGEAADGIEALSEVEKHKPDVLLLDLMLPGLNGLEVIRRVRQRFRRTRVLVLSMHQDQGYVARALLNGASGYVVKHADTSELLAAVRTVAAGQRHLSPPLSEWDVDVYMRKASASDTFDPYDTLTLREKEVLQLVAEGHTNPVIADGLCIGARTVETHRRHTMTKLGLKNHSELVRFAIERGIIPVNPREGGPGGPAAPGPQPTGS